MPIGLNETPSRSDCEGYIPISLDTLCPTPVLDFDLYIRADQANGIVLYRERNYPLDRDGLDRLLQQGVHTLYISSDSHAAYRRYLFDNVVRNTSAAPAQRYKVLTTVTRSAFNAAFRSISPDHMIEFADEFGRHMTEIVCSGELVLFDLVSLMQHDYYTYTHSVNVCTCSVALANMLWGKKAGDVRAIASGSLMHDIGKRRIPRFLLNKRRPLNEKERELIQQHPRSGFEELCPRTDVTWGGLMMVYQHHERMDGRGYPARLTGQEIHEWARLCAIADVFDAMRSDRPYRKAIQVREISEFLEERAGRDFDKEMVRCWKSAIRCKK